MQKQFIFIHHYYYFMMRYTEDSVTGRCVPSCYTNMVRHDLSIPGIMPQLLWWRSHQGGMSEQDDLVPDPPLS